MATIMAYLLVLESSLLRRFAMVDFPRFSADESEFTVVDRTLKSSAISRCVLLLAAAILTISMRVEFRY